MRIGLIINASILIAGLLAGHWLTDSYWSAKYSAYQSEVATESARAAHDATAKQQELIKQFDKAQADAKTQQARLKADADNLSATADSLRQQLSMHKATSTDASATITDLRRAAATNTVVREKLLQWSISANEELARFADDSRARGLACEKAYNSIRFTIQGF